MKSYNHIFETYSINEATTNIINLKTYDLQKRYDYWNKKAFDGKLPRRLNKIAAKKMKHIGGTVKVRAVVSGYKKEIVDDLKSIELYISTQFTFNQDELDKILLHEMVHVYFFTVKSRNINHGYDFIKKIKEISKKVKLELPETESIMDTVKTEKKINVMIVKEPSKIYIMLTSPNKDISAFVDKLSKHTFPKGTSVEFGLATTHLHNEYPLSMKKLSLYNIDNKQYNSIKWEDKQKLIL